MLVAAEDDDIDAAAADEVTAIASDEDIGMAISEDEDSPDIVAGVSIGASDEDALDGASDEETIGAVDRADATAAAAALLVGAEAMGWAEAEDDVAATAA